MTLLQLQKPLERAVRSGHPWIFRNALRPFDAQPGEVVTIADRRGDFLCRGLADSGPIGVRVFLTKDMPLDESLFRQRIVSSIRRRDAFDAAQTNAVRLIHGEGDGLPGVVLDRYADCAVLSFDGSALFAWQQVVTDALRPELDARGVRTLILRSRDREKKNIHALWGTLPEVETLVLENGMKLWVDLAHGQKTGMFLDHRDSRLRVRTLAHGKRVLNLYGYTGGFSVSAGLGGASDVTTVDSAPAAVALANRNWAENGLAPSHHRGVAADVAEFMRGGDHGYDVVISDPPSFAPSKAAVPNALKAYHMLHVSAMRAVKPHGLLLAASCSSHIRPHMFEQSLVDAARTCRRGMVILDSWGAGSDHPVLKAFAEGLYLKSYLVRVH
jgi:23S rRNA (cytosine1962-C5)-methyltransferase